MRNLGLLTLIVSVMVAIDALSTPLILSVGLLFPDAASLMISPIAAEIDGACLIFKFVTMIVFARWIYVAGANLLDAGFDDLEFSSGSRIWWFLVPIAALFKPFQGMRELWNASHGNTDYTEGNALVGTWWALWLIDRVSVYFGTMLYGPEDGATAGLWIQSAIGVALAGVAITMLRRIAAAQAGMSGPALEEVFA
jgi:hypothetical protein